jgi:hypothetical protein
MAAFRYVVSCGTDRRFRGTYSFLLMGAVSNSLHLNQLLTSIKLSWITIVKSDAETGLTSRYLAIIMMVVYSTRRLLTRECLSSKTTEYKLIYTAMLYIELALSSNLLLGIDWTCTKPSSVCPYSNLPSLANWSGQVTVLSDPLLDIPSIFHARLTHFLMQIVSISETQVSFCQATQCSVQKEWLSPLKLFLCAFLRNIESTTTLSNIQSCYKKVIQSWESRSSCCIWILCLAVHCCCMILAPGPLQSSGVTELRETKYNSKYFVSK